MSHTRSRLLRTPLASRLAILGLLALAPLAATAQQILAPGDAVARDLASGDAHEYTLDLAEGHIVLGAADQETVDVVVTLRGPNGERVRAFDAPARGPEPFRFTTEASGVHTLTVTPYGGEEGRYTMRLTLMEPLATTPEGMVDQRFATYGEGTPGGAVAVVRGDEVVFARGYGMADLAHDAPITPETRFNIASVSKGFTAFAIALLAERGDLSLDADIRTILPELRIDRPVTVRQLAQHTGGVRGTFGLAALSGRGEGDLVTHSLLVNLLARQQGLNFEPGTAFEYSNGGYVLMAEIVERVTGESFPTWMQTNVFEPLGMGRTFVGSDYRAVVRDMARPYLASGGGYAEAVYPYAGYGPGNVRSTVGDLARWMRNLSTGEVGGETIRRLMLERGVIASGDTTDYAFGLFVESEDGLMQVSHSGAFDGVRANFAYYPDIDAGVILLSNDGALNPVIATDEIADAFYGADIEAASGATGGTPEGPKSIQDRMVEIDAATFDAHFAGRYEFDDTPGYVFTFARDSTRYTIQILDGPASQIWPVSPTRFSSRTGVLELTFNRLTNGPAESVTIHQNGDDVASRIPDTSSPFVPEDYAGRYLSDEVGSVFEARVVDGALVLEHPRQDEPVTLTHSWGDHFRGDYPFRGVAFERDARGAISGFWVSTVRATGVRFEKVP